MVVKIVDIQSFADIVEVILVAVEDLSLRLFLVCEAYEHCSKLLDCSQHIRLSALAHPDNLSLVSSDVLPGFAIKIDVEWVCSRNCLKIILLLEKDGCIHEVSL